MLYGSVLGGQETGIKDAGRENTCGPVYDWGLLSVGVAGIRDKMKECRLQWFGHVLKRGGGRMTWSGLFWE